MTSIGGYICMTTASWAAQATRADYCMLVSCTDYYYLRASCTDSFSNRTAAYQHERVPVTAEEMFPKLSWSASKAAWQPALTLWSFSWLRASHKDIFMTAISIKACRLVWEETKSCAAAVNWGKIGWQQQQHNSYREKLPGLAEVLRYSGLE